MRFCHEPLAGEIGQPLPTFTTLNKLTYFKRARHWTKWPAAPTWFHQTLLGGVECFFSKCVSGNIAAKFACCIHLFNSSKMAAKKVWEMGFEPVSEMMLYQLSYEATQWERGQFIAFISSQAVKWGEVDLKGGCTCRWVFQASSFLLLKLEHLLRWSLFTFWELCCWKIWNGNVPWKRTPSIKK